MATSLPQATAQVPAPPAPPTPAVVAGTQGTATTNGVILKVPTTPDEVSALRAQRRELSNQLNSAAGRREDLAAELKEASGADRAGIQARIDLLDQRILQIEADIATTGQLIASTDGSLLGGAGPSIPSPIGNMRPDMTAISVVFTIFVLMPIAVAMARLLWKRGNLPKATPSFDRENAERLQRLESAVDSIAIEMERVSEGQRFVTKLLSESRERARVEAPRS